MKKLTVLALIGAVSFGSAAMADTTQSDINADKGAIRKDDAALAKDNAGLSQDRAEKAAAKAKGDYVGQAKNSMDIGVDKVTKGAKKTERSADTSIMAHDKKSKAAADAAKKNSMEPAAGSDQ